MPNDRLEPVRVYESDRRFQLWRYQVSHSQLLLRSVKTPSQSSRVDILFKGVDEIQLPTVFTGLTISAEGRQYVLDGHEWNGGVIAEACFVAEDDGEFFDPSPFETSF